MLKPKVLKIAIYILSTVLLLIFLYYFNKSTTVSFNQQGGTSYIKYEKAEILRIVDESLEKDESISNLYRGYQELEVKILTGEHKGEIHNVKNYLSNLFNVYGRAGLIIIVSVDTADPNTYSVSVNSYYRSPVLFGLIVIFFAVLWFIGGKKGFKSVVGLIFTFVLIIFLMLPMIYRGYSPVFVSVLIVIVTTCVALFLLNGLSSKTISAILGTTLGVIIAGLVSSLAGHLAHISGFNTEDVETLVVVAKDHGMKIGELLFAGILIASLGAIMDVAMSVASSIHEVYYANPKLGKKDLFLSGINVGKDMMGTMSNTLILAFTGTSLNSLLLIYSYNVSFNQLINMNMIGIEIIQGLSGSIAVILTVPIISYISSRLIPANNVEV